MSADQRSDRDAEAALLAACIESKTARAEARRHIFGADFDDPRHEAIWDAMTALDRNGKGVDMLTINATLGASAAAHLLPGILTMMALPDNVAEYAQIVRGWAVRRKIDAAAREAAQQAFAPGNPGTLAAKVASRFIAIRDGDANTGDDMTAVTATELLAEQDDEPEWLIPGLLERRDRLMLTGEEGLGKALDVDTPIPTPKGWTTMGDLRAGSWVFAPDGKPTRVLATTEVMHDRPCYRVTFSDGSSIVADENHLWETRDFKARQPRAFAERAGETKPRGTDQRHKRAGYDPAVRTTRELADTLYARGGHTLNHSIDTCAPLNYPVVGDLLVDPYTLGAWLGDGSSRSGAITTHPDDSQILDEIRAGGWAVRATKQPMLWGIGDGKGSGKRGTATFAGCLRALGVFGDKYIPTGYLHAGIGERLALLQGLMDTDGTIGTGVAPIAEFCVCSERLARDVHELLLGLGIKVKWAEGPAKIDGRTVGTRYRLAFQTDLPIFRLRRKAERLVTPRTKRYARRYITAVEPIESVPVRCIQVEGSMFLAGRECIPTHNSHMLRQFAIGVAAGLHPFHQNIRIPQGKAVIIDCENTRSQVRRKIRPSIEWVRRYGDDPADRLVIDCTNRMDITRDKDLARIHQVLDAVQPDLVVIGPLYRLVPRALQTDDDTAPVLAALDTIRDRGAAVLIEAHAGHAIGKGGTRDLRPRGSSSLLGWPEFGYGMKAVSEGYCDLVPWRGNREERDWPQRMRRADGFRWIPHADLYGWNQDVTA